MKLLQLTDPHLVAPGMTLKGLDPERRLRECLSDIEDKHGDAVALIIPGDIAESADPEAYALLRRVLGEYRLPPVHMTIGNHDRREVFASTFPESMDPVSGFASTSFSLGNYAGLLLDTWESGQHGGRLCETRLEWLWQRLARDARPTLVFMHHAPFRVGLKRLDQIPLENGGDLFEVLNSFRDRVRHLFFGHMHRNISGSWNGIPFSVVAGTTHQIMLDFETDLVRETELDPTYAVILIDGGTVVVHHHQVRPDWKVIERRPGPTNDQIRAGNVEVALA